MKIRWILILLFVLTSLKSFADLVSSDRTYKVHSIPGFEIIYSEEYESLIPELQSYVRWFQSTYQKEFAWELDQDTVIILASSRNQIPNAFVAPFPRLYSTFYNGSAQFAEEFAARSWLYSLVTHELIHLYQVNAKGDWGQALHSVLGNAAPSLVPIPPFTYTMYPHAFTPTFLMEGNATFNEGRFGNGGRLHSGLYRALFLQLLQDEQVNAKRLMNDHLDWPYGTEKYIVGGYLQSHLAEEFGVERTNRFFVNHAQHEFFPFRINESFKETFGQGYKESIKQLKRKYQPLADQQKSAQGVVVSTSKEHSGFTEVDGQPSFMRSDFNSELQACQWKTGRNELCCEDVRLPFGRLFRHGKKWVSASYQRVSPTLLQAGLFKPGFKPVKGFEDKFVYGKTGDDILYAASAESFKTLAIYKNKEKIADAQSTAFLSDKGDVYYFIHDEKGRHLYRNQAYITSIDGYYSHVVDVGPADEIYYVANTPSGSGLFVHDKGVTQRAHSSDLIVDAKLLSENQLLVAEITKDGYRYLITELETSRDEPVHYKYSYDNAASEIFNTPTASAPLAVPDQDKKYRPFSEIEFTGADLAVNYFSDSGFNGFLNFRFSDPLQRHLAELQIRDSGWSSPGARLQYFNLKNRLNWSLAVDYEKVAYLRTLSTGESELLGHSEELLGFISLMYPIQQNAISRNALSLNYIHEVETADETAIISRVDETPLNKGIFSYDFRYAFSPGPLSYRPTSAVNLDLDFKYQGEGSAWKPGAMVYAGELGFTRNLSWDFFLTSSYKAALAEGELAAIELNDDIVAALDPTEFNALANVDTEDFFQLRRVTVELIRPFHIGLYHNVFPLGLRRLAPLAGYAEYYGSKVKNQEAQTLFHQVYYGVEAEILLLHKFPARLKYLTVQTGKTETQQVVLGLQSSF